MQEGANINVLHENLLLKQGLFINCILQQKY